MLATTSLDLPVGARRCRRRVVVGVHGHLRLSVRSQPLAAATLTRCVLSSDVSGRTWLSYGFKTDPVGGEALDERVRLSVVDLPSAMSVTDRLLDIVLRQMLFVKPKQGVIGPELSEPIATAESLRVGLSRQEPWE